MKKYQPINLPLDLVEELKIWRQAFMVAWGRTVSYAEMLRSMLDNLDADEPDVCRVMDMIIKEHPELAGKIGKYKGAESDDKEINK